MTLTAGRQVLAKGKAVNICDGGALMAALADELRDLPQAVLVRIGIPRATPNTYMLEEVACQATILRRQPMPDAKSDAVALQFDRPMELGLEV